jgi:hypothetical protein
MKVYQNSLGKEVLLPSKPALHFVDGEHRFSIYFYVYIANERCIRRTGSQIPLCNAFFSFSQGKWR